MACSNFKISLSHLLEYLQDSYFLGY